MQSQGLQRRRDVYLEKELVALHHGGDGTREAEALCYGIGDALELAPGAPQTRGIVLLRGGKEHVPAAGIRDAADQLQRARLPTGDVHGDGLALHGDLRGSYGTCLFSSAPRALSATGTFILIAWRYHVKTQTNEGQFLR